MRVLLNRVLNTMAGATTRAKFGTAQKEQYLNMPIDEKRAQYACGPNQYCTLEDAPVWPLYAKLNPASYEGTPAFDVNSDLNDKVRIFSGDITRLEVDAIVNAANRSLAGGGGVDGAIHRAAGKELKRESVSLAPCETGEAKLTGGYRLPANYVIHTVGPRGERPTQLASCYEQCLKLCVQSGLRSVAFPCISTGVYGYPNEAAAEVALSTCRTMLEKHADQIMEEVGGQIMCKLGLESIVFCLFMEVDKQLYGRLLHKYFPLA